MATEPGKLDVVAEEQEEAESPSRKPQTHRKKRQELPEVIDKEFIKSKMTEFVDGIDGQFEFVIKSHEEDFISAYHGHMTKVKSELLFLKQKAIEAAGKLSNDDGITQL